MNDIDVFFLCACIALHEHSSQSALGDAITVDQKDYYCVEIGLPDAPKGPTTELFMLDTAATSSLLTPRAYERLGEVGGFSRDSPGLSCHLLQAMCFGAAGSACPIVYTRDHFSRNGV